MEANSIALKRAEEASSDEMARDWSMVAARIARRSGRRVSLLDVIRRTLSEWLALGLGKPGSSLIQGRRVAVDLGHPADTAKLDDLGRVLVLDAQKHDVPHALVVAQLRFVLGAGDQFLLKRTAPSMSR